MLHSQREGSKECSNALTNSMLVWEVKRGTSPDESSEANISRGDDPTMDAFRYLPLSLGTRERSLGR